MEENKRKQAEKTAVGSEVVAEYLSEWLVTSTRPSLTVTKRVSLGSTCSRF